MKDEENNQFFHSSFFIPQPSYFLLFVWVLLISCLSDIIGAKEAANFQQDCPVKDNGI
jgi:hypothetical protein